MANRFAVYCTLMAVAGVPVHAFAQSTLMGASFEGDLFVIDVATGAGLLVGSLPPYPDCPDDCLEPEYRLNIGIEFDNKAKRAYAQRRPGGGLWGLEFDITTGMRMKEVRPVTAKWFTALEVIDGTWYGMRMGHVLSTFDPFEDGTQPQDIGDVGVAIEGLAYDQTSGTLYGIGGTGPVAGGCPTSYDNLYTIDLSTGEATLVGNTGIRAGSLEFGLYGRLYAGGGSAWWTLYGLPGTCPENGNLYAIDPSSGASTLIGPTGFDSPIVGLALVDNSAFNCDGTLYGVDGSWPRNLYTIDPATGATVATIGPIRDSQEKRDFDVLGLAAHPVTCGLWGVAEGEPLGLCGDCDVLIKIDRRTAAATLLNGRGRSGHHADITFLSDGTPYTVGWTNGLFLRFNRFDLRIGDFTDLDFLPYPLPVPLPYFSWGLAASPNDVLSTAGIDNGDLFTIDPTIPSATPTVALSGTTGKGISALASDCTGTLYGTRGPLPYGVPVDDLITIDPTTGAVTSVATLDNVGALAFTCGPTPGTTDPTDFYTVTPCRVFDTRKASGPTLGAPLTCGTEYSFPVAGKCEVPATAKAVAVNLTGTGSTAQGNLRLFASGNLMPLASSLNYAAGQTRANNAVAPLGAGGQISTVCSPSGTTHVILDVNGYFE
jgi:hypothetical protein